MNFVFSSHFSHPSSSPTEVLLPSKPCPTLMESFRVWPTGDNYRALSETKSCILENERLALSLTCVRRQTLLSMGWGVNFHTRSTTQCGWVHSCTNNQNTELLRTKALSVRYRKRPFTGELSISGIPIRFSPSFMMPPEPWRGQYSCPV